MIENRDLEVLSQEDLLEIYQNLINNLLPKTYQKPVKYNHCFNRIILDWLFQDVWYRHLNRNIAAYKQLNKEQLIAMITRMQEWLKDVKFLYADNDQSLKLRAVFKQKKP